MWISQPFKLRDLCRQDGGNLRVRVKVTIKEAVLFCYCLLCFVVLGTVEQLNLPTHSNYYKICTKVTMDKILAKMGEERQKTLPLVEEPLLFDSLLGKENPFL